MKTHNSPAILPVILAFLCLTLPFNVLAQTSATKVASELRVVKPVDLMITNLRGSDLGQTVVNHAIGGTTMHIGGRTFETGIGMAANGTLHLRLEGGEGELHTWVGVDDQTLPEAGGVEFYVFGDERELWRSGVIHKNEAARELRLPLRGVHLLTLWTTDLGDGKPTEIDWAYNGRPDWAGLEFRVVGFAPKAVPAPAEPLVLLTPQPGKEPHINGPLVYGVRPGHDFLYRIPCTGERPIEFSVRQLPDGLVLDKQSGIIRGTTPAAGNYPMTLVAKSAQGMDMRAFKIIAGDTLALTPPMGWNSWYAHYRHISDSLMRAAADAMVTSGMADVGYQYVNVDDCWMNSAGLNERQHDPERIGKVRDTSGNFRPNRFFPDMRAMTDYIHARGLKTGIYTSPGPFTCGGFEGSYHHEAQDARQFADWGFDFLKYDWCSYSWIAYGRDPNATNIPPCGGHAAPNLESKMIPYRLMGELIRKQKRDIIFNVCDSGYDNVCQWGQAVGAQTWRTGPDLGLFMSRVFETALLNAKHGAFSKPGSWNDPDFIQIGMVGDAEANSISRPCDLSPNEQYAFMSLWCMMAAPLFYSGDMARLDPLTLNVLCNPEVIAVDQDELGQSARVIPVDRRTFIMLKDMVDGSKVVGLFNRGPVATSVRVAWEDLGLQGPQRTRDLWRQRNLGVLEKSFESGVPRRGGILIRVWPESVLPAAK
jgi:alpha-galactosidase